MTPERMRSLIAESPKHKWSGETVLALLDALDAAERAVADVQLAQAVAAVTPCSCSAQRARADRAEAELDRLHSWAGLMELLDEHWPESIFPTLPDSTERDAGPRIVSLIRRVDAAEAAVQRVRDLHRPDTAGDCTGCRPRGMGFTVTHPCATIRALDGDA